MIGRIIKHEWHLLVTDRLLFVILPIYAILIAYGVYNGAAWKQFLFNNTAAATAQADKNLKAVDHKFALMASGVKLAATEDPSSAGKMSRTTAYDYAIKPPEPMATIAIGQSDVFPSYVRVQWRALFNQSNMDEVENPVNLAIGRFDLSFVLIYLYPLLIIALSYNILSSERENGTQALLLSQPVSLAQFVTGKILLRGAVIIGGGVGLSLLGLLISSPDVFTGPVLWRIAMWLLVIIAYGVFWFGLAVLVNAFPNKSSTNALILIGAWLLLVLLVPATLNLLAKSLYPVPSRIELVQAMRRGDAIAQQERAAAKAAGGGASADLAARSGEDAVVDSMKDFYKNVLPLDMRGEAAAAPIFERFNGQLAAQQRLTDRLKYLSPSIVTQDAVAEIASTGRSSFANFRAAADAYHQQWRQYFYPRVMAGAPLTRAELAAIPRYRYVAEGDGVVFGRLAGSLFALLVAAGAVLAIGFACLKRYPVAAR